MNIEYTIGDATSPEGGGPKIILHCCNDAGLWGAGFALALSNKWAELGDEYTRWYMGTLKDSNASSMHMELGEIQVVPVTATVAVCNLIGQRGTGLDRAGNPPIRYDAILKGLRALTERITGLRSDHFARCSHVPSYTDHPVSIHCPRFGSGLAGGNWDIIEILIQETLIKAGIPVTVYV